MSELYKEKSYFTEFYQKINKPLIHRLNDKNIIIIKTEAASMLIMSLEEDCLKHEKYIQSNTFDMHKFGIKRSKKANKRL